MNESWGGLDGRIGPYQIVRELGRGTSGRVFLCQHSSLGFQHAVKVLALEAAEDSESLKRFKRETQMLAAADHPGIVRIHAAGFSQGRPYFAMDYVEGVTLQAARKAGLPVDQVLDVIEEVSLALGHVHRRGMVHRDVKPANIMVCDGHARLTDFGLAKMLGVRSQRLTQTGDLLGTPAYMAPEQADPSLGKISPATDVFALGAMLYEAFEGVQPFHSATSTDLFMRLMRHEKAPAVRSPEASPRLRQVCERALAVEPRERYADGLAFFRALAEARSPAAAEQPAGAQRIPPALSGLALLVAGVALGAVPAVALSDRAQPVPAAAPPPAVVDAAPVTQEPSPPEPGPRLLTLDEIERLPPQRLRLGVRVTALSENGALYLATIVEDHGDAGYVVVYADGYEERVTPPLGGFLPDVFYPGAQVRTPSQHQLSGTVLRRKGLAVLVEFEGDERRWFIVPRLSLAPSARVPTPGELPETGLVFSRWSDSDTFYPAVEIDRRGGKIRVIYVEDGSIEWRDAEDISGLPGPDAVVICKTTDSERQRATVVKFLGDSAVLLRFSTGEERWVGVGRITR